LRKLRRPTFVDIKIMLVLVLVPSPDVSGRGAKKQTEGPKTRRGGHIFTIQHWMYAATGGPNVKWGGAPISNGGAGHCWAPRWRRPWLVHWLVYCFVWLS